MMFANPWDRKVPYSGGNAGHNAPGQTKDTVVGIYIPSLFRGVGGQCTSSDYKNTVDYYGLKTHEYEIPQYLMNKASKEPDNAVYDLYKWDGTFVNMTSPTSLPSFICNKHNLWLEQDAMDLYKLYTNASKKEEVTPIHDDRTYMNVEPNSGIALYIQLSIQLNYLLEENSLLTSPERIIPIFSMIRNVSWTEHEVTNPYFYVNFNRSRIRSMI